MKQADYDNKEPPRLPSLVLRVLGEESKERDWSIFIALCRGIRPRK